MELRYILEAEVAELADDLDMNLRKGEDRAFLLWP